MRDYCTAMIIRILLLIIMIIMILLLGFKVTNEVCGKSVDPWECVVRGVVMGRAKAVVDSQLSSAREATVQMLITLTNDILNNQK